jgi:hypothetical protein
MTHRLLFISLVLSSGAYGNNLDPGISGFLDNPWDTFAKDNTPGGFRIVALSHIAEGCLAISSDSPPEATDCVSRIVELALDPRISPYVDPAKEELGHHGLYLSHLNITLGAYQAVSKDNRYQELNARISNHLAAGSLAEPTATFPSFPGEPARWPADQAATLHSLHLYDSNFGQDIAKAPIAAWQSYLAKSGIDKKTGLHVSELTSSKPHSGLPRGCALAWTVRYSVGFDRPWATALWERFVGLYAVEMNGLSGLREWPPGKDGPADIDSGPILFGIGTAASAFGLTASRLVGDVETAQKLSSSRQLALLVAKDDPKLSAANSGVLGQAITFHADQIGP